MREKERESEIEIERVREKETVDNLPYQVKQSIFEYFQGELEDC